MPSTGSEKSSRSNISKSKAACLQYVVAIAIIIAVPKRRAACRTCGIHDLYNPPQIPQLPTAAPGLSYAHTYALIPSSSASVRVPAASSLALKVRRRGEEGDALIHDRLAHPQVVVQPLLHARGVAELLGLHTGAERQRVSLLFAMLWAFRGSGDMVVAEKGCSRAGEGATGLETNVREAGGAADASQKGGD